MCGAGKTFRQFPSWSKPPIGPTMRYSATRFFHHTSICYPALIEPGTTAQSHATSIDTVQVIGFIDNLDVLILLKSGYLLPPGATLSSRLLRNRQRPHMEHVTHNQHIVDRVDLGRSFTLESFSTFKKKVAADGKEMAQVLVQHLLASPEPSTQHRVLRKHRNYTRESYGRCNKSKRKGIQVERCIFAPPRYRRVCKDGCKSKRNKRWSFLNPILNLHREVWPVVCSV